MVAPGHSAHHPRPLWLVLADYPLCPSLAPRSTLACAPDRLVSQIPAHFFRHPGLRSPDPLAPFHFLSVAAYPRHATNSHCTFSTSDRYTRFFTLIWIKSSLEPVMIKQTGSNPQLTARSRLSDLDYSNTLFVILLQRMAEGTTPIAHDQRNQRKSKMVTGSCPTCIL